MWKKIVKAATPEVVKSGETAVQRAHAAAEESHRLRLELERRKKLKSA